MTTAETKAAGITAEQYGAAIPECCEYQGLQAHMDGLMLCWRLTAAIEAGRPMDCGGCDMATRKPANAELKGAAQ